MNQKESRGAPPAGLGSYAALAREHAGLVVGGAVAGLVAIRIAAVSEWNQQTAAALLQYTDGTGVLLGATLGMIPMLLLYALAFSLAHNLWRCVVRMEPLSVPVGLRMLAACLWVILIASLVQLALVLLIIGAAAAFGVMDRNRDSESAPGENARVATSIITSLLLFSYLWGSSPWLPTEAIETPRETFTGFVVGRDDSGRLVVLRDQPRQIEFLRESQIRDRGLCANPSLWLSTVPQLLGASRPDYVGCPKTGA